MPRYRARYFGELPGASPGTIRKIAQGEEFDFEGKPGLWMEPVTTDTPPVQRPDPEPTTFYELAAIEAKRQADALARLEGNPVAQKRGPGRPRKAEEMFNP